MSARAGFFVLVALAVLACAVGSSRGVRPHQWWRARGPVVPHDTFPADCSLCHTGKAWNVLRADFHFDHEKETGVALRDAHARAECLRCHNDRGPVQSFAARGCAGCHVDVHEGQLGRDCSACHGERDWRASEQIRAHARTRFPLVGAHVAAACWRCHPGAQAGNYLRADTACVSCHGDDLARATSPDHVGNGWTDTCERCHIATAWTGSAFNHGFWPLTGFHKTLDCNNCHPSQTYVGTSTACFACHKGHYNNAQDPDHLLLNLSVLCELCHDTVSWDIANFAHLGIAAGCVECHLDDYQATSDPDHAAAGFGTTCEQCHTSTSTWHQVSSQGAAATRRRRR